MAPRSLPDELEPYDVVLAGYGPTGELLANLLGARGYRVAVFERAIGVYHMPRAAHLDHEAMRVFQSVGLADVIEPTTAYLRGMHFLDAAGGKLFGFEQPPPPTAMGWDIDYVFYQPTLEALLRSGVDRYPNVDVYEGWEVDAVRDLGEAVEVTVRQLDGDGLHTVTAAWAVGCDGARSVTRRAAGITRHDLGFDESWLVVDVALTEPLALPDVCQQICDPARPTTYVPMPEPYRRWEFMLLPGEAVPDMEDRGRVAELLAPWLDGHPYEIVRAVVYTFHAVLAEGWRAGRVLVAGDAAHLMPPFLGQGMCSGLRDAANLGWKLALVLDGRAPATLLDTYESERSPHVRTIIDLAVTFGGIICTTDPVAAAERDAGFRANPHAFDPGEDGSALLPPLGPGVVDPDAPAAVGGRLFVQPWVANAAGERVRFDDATGPGFVLLSRTGDPAAALGPATGAVWRALGGVAATLDAGVDPAVAGAVPLVDADGHLGRWFDRTGTDVVLLRPDRYVFGASGTVDDAEVLVGRLARALGLAG